MKLSPACYGKLPVHADFIRVQSGGALTRFDGWLQQGMLAWQKEAGDAWTKGFEAMPRQRFVLHDPASESYLVGVLAPSKGKAGRHYPFVVATALPEEKRLRQRPALIPLICDDFLNGAEALLDAGGGADKRAVQAAVAQLPTAVDLEGAERRLEAALQQTPQEILLIASAGAWDQRRYALYATLRERLSGKERPLLLPTALATGVVALWFEVLAASRGKRGSFPHLTTWGPATGSAGDLRFLVRPPAGEDFAPLLLRRGPQGLEDLTSVTDLRQAQLSAGTLAGDGKAPVSKLVSGLRD